MVRGYYAGAGLVYQGGPIQAKEMGGSNCHSLYRRGGRDGLRGGNLDLDSLTLTGLSLDDVAAGSTTVNLTGEWERDLSAVVRGGAGEVTVLLSRQVGVRVNAGTRLGRVNAEGLQQRGEAFVNDAYGDSEVTLEVNVEGGLGQINVKTN
jgi:hypothetical protein